MEKPIQKILKLEKEKSLPKWLSDKEFACQAGGLSFIQSLGDPLEKEMTTHPSILAWKIPRTEKPGGLQSTGSQRVRHNAVIQ